MEKEKKEREELVKKGERWNIPDRRGSVQA